MFLPMTGKNRFKARVSSARSFTLVETLLGLAIFGIVAAGLYGVVFGALRLEKKVREVHQRCREIRLAFGALSRDLENALPYPFDKQLSDRLAFEGHPHRMEFFIPTDEGIWLVEYSEGTVDFGRIKRTVVRRVKNIREIFGREESRAPIQYLLRREQRLTDLLAGHNDKDDVQAVASGLQQEGLRFHYGKYNGTTGQRQVTFQDDWKDNRLPDVIRVECFFHDPSDPENPVRMSRDIFLIVKELST
jgi:prepilin-type N-terminal cleavage/methylation domain-containing protein